MYFLIILIITAVASAASTTSVNTCSKHPNVRKEWRDTSDDEKKAFIDAITCLGKMPNEPLKLTGATPDLPPFNASSSKYDDFVYAHMDSNNKDHFTGLFFPWHRWFLHTFETALKNKCGFDGTLIFWDWSRDVASIPKSPIFNSSSTHGIGTLGTAASGYAVTNGAFGSTIRAYPFPHVVQRNYTLYPFLKSPFPFAPLNPELAATDVFAPQAMAKVVNGSIGNFTDFAYNMDGVRAQGMHNAAHLMLGGDMSSLLWSPNDPIFYMHHAHLDCIWARWQSKHPKNAMAYGGGLTQDVEHYDKYPVGAPPRVLLTSELPTVGLSDPVKVKDMMYTRSRNLCYQCAY